MSKKIFKLNRKGNVNENAEITASMKEHKRISRMLNGKNEIMLLIRDPKTRLLKRYNSYTSKRELNRVEKKLNDEGIKTVQVHKEITENQYSGYFMVADENYNIKHELGLDAALKELNKIHKDDMNLRKQRSHKETMGYIAFAYKEKSNEVVCTRLYDTEEKALMFIQRRQGISHNTIRCFKVVRYYKGFEFKHQDLDDCHRIKEAKSKLGGM